MHGLLKSFSYAIRGIRIAVMTQRNMKIHLFITLAVFLAGFFFHISSREWIVLILSILIVLFGEMVNTSIEKVVDLISPEYHVLAGQAKDIAAGAVLLSAMGTIVVGILVFSPYIMEWVSSYVTLP